MEIKKVTVFGAGNFGARLAFHIAFNKVDVTVYDRDYGLLEEARTRFRELGNDYQRQFGATTEEIEAGLANIAYSMDITEAAGNAQLIIEAVAEDLKAKKGLYEELQKSAPKNALFATTSKGLDPEVLAKASGRPRDFLNLQFDGKKDFRTTIEIVELTGTSKEALQKMEKFFDNIGMLPKIKNLERQK